jgi:hypothetical protein
MELDVPEEDSIILHCQVLVQVVMAAMQEVEMMYTAAGQRSAGW